MSNGLLRLVVSFASVDRLSGSLKGIVGLAQSGSERLAGMKREARDLERELRDVRTAQTTATGNVTHLVDKEAALSAQLNRTNRQMEEQVRLLKLANMTDRMRARGEALKSSGQSNMLGGAAILGGLGVAAKGAADFQTGMTDIALKAELTNRETAKLQVSILAAARAAKTLPESLRAGVDTLAGFGMSPQQATAMIAPIGKVATAYRAQIDDLASASYANFSNLKVPVMQTARALEVMAAAGNAGAFEIKDMAQYFPSLTAQAQAFGQSGVAAVADLAAAAQIARKGTGDSASAAGNLQNLMAKINTEETIKKFAKMGVDLPAALKKAYAEGKTPLEAIATITDKTLGGKLDKLSFLFGDMQAQSALRPLIQNMDEYRRIRADALASKGAVDAAFARRSQDAAVQAQALIGNLQRLAITVGPVLLPGLIKVSDTLLSITDGVAAWAQANPRTTSTIVGLVAGMGALKLGLGAAQIAFGAVLGPMGSVLGFVLRNGPMVARTFGVMRIAAMFLARGVMQAGLMMLANPIVAAIVAIVAVLGFAAYKIYQNWSAISGYFTRHWTYIRNLLLGAMVIFAPLLAAAVYVARMIYTHWGAISGAVGGAMSAVGNFVMSSIGMLAGFAGRILAPFSGIIATIGGFAAQFYQIGVNLIAGLWNGIMARAKALLAGIANLAAQVGGKFANALGIKSPSRVFMAYGGHIVGGLAQGIDRRGGHAVAAVARLGADIAGTGMQMPGMEGMSGAGGRRSGFDLPQLERLGSKPSGKGGSTTNSSASSLSFAAGSIVIQGAAGQSAESIAMEVTRQISALMEKDKASSRSAFRDDE